jgi:hypothetical protein
MGKDPAAQIAAQLLLDVARQVLATLLAHRREEGLQMLAHHDVQSASHRKIWGAL